MVENKIRAGRIEVRLRQSGIFSAFFRPFAVQGDRYSGLDFTDISALRQLLNNEKARILHTLKERKPNSLYDLAKMLNRDFKSVRKDVELLKNFGFIRLQPEAKGKRKKLKPIHNLERLDISITL